MRQDYKSCESPQLTQITVDRQRRQHNLRGRSVFAKKDAQRNAVPPCVPAFLQADDGLPLARTQSLARDPASLLSDGARDDETHAGDEA